MSQPTVFISYSHKDERWKNLLMKHLGVLQSQGLIDIWQDRLIEAGADWHANIQEAMKAASIAVVIITGNSLTSEYILGDEMPALLARRQADGVRVFPLIAEPCAWQSVGWLRRLNLRPTDARPLSSGDQNQIDADLAALTSEVYLLTKSVAAPRQREFVPLNPDAVSVGRLPPTGRDLFGRDLELELLDGAWADEGTNVLTLVAWGGVGKSALVNHWRRALARDNWRGAERVYAWSFEQQGTGAQGTSADQFIASALRWFGDPAPDAGTPWDKGERLAQLIKGPRTLLLLDGLEPLQFPPARGQQAGALKEPAMKVLLGELAADNTGLCVITSRLAVADLAGAEGDTVRRVNLEHLSPQAGARLLRERGVKGEAAELELAANEFGGHALALSLLGGYLATVHGGDVTRRDRLDILREDEEQGGQASRVMATYEGWFGEGPELSVLRLLAVFDRPADGPAVAALRADPAIHGLTDTLRGLGEEDWRRALHRLRTAELIADLDPARPETLDTHPLVRGYFRRQLRRTNPDAWREGNSRLYEHLRDTAPRRPGTVEEMAPLFAAVAHGCAAGRHEEALGEVFKRRLERDDRYAIHKLGAAESCLAAISHFFDPPWERVVPGLSKDDEEDVLNVAGVCLSSLGRLTEAARPSQIGLDSLLSRNIWDGAAVAAVNLGDIYASIGDLKQNLKYASDAVGYARRSGEFYARVFAEAAYAAALYRAGRAAEAKALLRSLEEAQKAQPGPPQPQFLYGNAGFYYCALLLEEGGYDEVLKRASFTHWLATRERQMVSTAFDLVSLVRAALLRDPRMSARDFDKATSWAEQSVSVLRQSGAPERLPVGLLARAELRRVKGEFEAARADLDETMTIATRGGMGLYQADCHLERARLYLAEGEKEKARGHWGAAREMVGRMGYHLRDREVRELGEALGEGADG